MKEFALQVHAVTSDGTKLVSFDDAQAIITILCSKINTSTNEVLAKRIAELERQLSDERMKNLRLTSERDDLLVYALDAENWFSKHDPFGYISPKQKEAQQCLIEIRIEAVKEFVTFLPAYSYNLNAELEKKANEYAIKLKEGK